MKPTQPSPRRTAFRLGFIGLVAVAVALLLVVYRQNAIDMFVAYQERDNPYATTFAKTAHLSDRGEFLLRASRAQVSQRADFNKNCAGLVEQTVVLGCYSAQRIYVYDIKDERLTGIKEVTMAHEMLHAAYERLSDNERARVDGWLQSQYESITDERFRETVKSYETLEPGEQMNELHSMLATEIEALSPELEQYYARYFSDRKAVVGLAKQYESVFVELEQQQKQLVAELDGLAQELESAVPAYEQQANALLSEIDRFNSAARSGGFDSSSEFAVARSQLVSQQSRLESERLRINAMVDRYNQGKSELDALNLQASDLQKSIDSIESREVPAL